MVDQVYQLIDSGAGQRRFSIVPHLSQMLQHELDFGSSLDGMVVCIGAWRYNLRHLQHECQKASFYALEVCDGVRRQLQEYF